MTRSDLRKQWELRVGPDAADALMRSYRWVYGAALSLMGMLITWLPIWPAAIADNFGLLFVFIGVSCAILGYLSTRKGLKLAAKYLGYQGRVGKIRVKNPASFDRWAAKNLK